MICCGMAVKKDGNVRSECEEDEGTLIVKMETLLMGEGR